MSEPQAVETEQPAEDLQPSEVSESASEKEPEKVTFSEEQQKLVDGIVGKKTFKVREAERKAEDLQKKLDEAQANVPRETRPNVPSLPDPYSDNYENEMKARDEGLKEAAAFDARENLKVEQAEEAKKTQETQEHQAYEEKGKVYAQRATQLGLSNQEMESAGNAVINYGLDGQLIDYLLDQEQGPLMTLYLSKNPLELDKLRTMSPMNGAIYLDSEVKSKAVVLKPQTTSAPEPPDTLTGSGFSSDRGPKGATYE